MLLKFNANVHLRQCHGETALDKAKSQQVLGKVTPGASIPVFVATQAAKVSARAHCELKMQLVTRANEAIRRRRAEWGRHHT